VSRVRFDVLLNAVALVQYTFTHKQYTEQQRYGYVMNSNLQYFILCHDGWTD